MGIYEIVQIVGIVGAGFDLYAFIKVQLNQWTVEDYWFDLFNFIGSVLLFVYALFPLSIPFAVLNLVWGAFSLKDLIGKRKNAKTNS